MQKDAATAKSLHQEGKLGKISTNIAAGDQTKERSAAVPLLWHVTLQMKLSLHLKHVCIFERSPTSCLHAYAGSVSLAIFWALVQILGFDEVQALVKAGCFKLHKV